LETKLHWTILQDIPKGPHFQKYWSHINPQTGYDKQHKHVDLIPHDVIDHDSMVSRDGLGLYFNGKAIPRSEGGNWKLNFDYERAAELGFHIQIKISDSIFKSNAGSLGRSALWMFLGMFDCRYGSEGGYW